MNKLAVQTAAKAISQAIKNPDAQTAIAIASIPVMTTVINKTYKIAKGVMEEGYELSVKCMFFDFELARAK